MLRDEDFENKKFIYPESDKFEYKESIVENKFEKYLQTICGFLNSGGGNLIFGIRDNLDLVGLGLKNKFIDKMILRIDSIIAEKQIIGVDKDTEEYVFLDSSNIKPRQLITKLDKRFLIIEIVSKPNIKYQLVGGMVYYRLGASNYFEKSVKLYKENDFETACKNIKKKAEQENTSNIKLFQKTLEEKNNDVKILNEKINELEEKNLIYQTHLKNSINIINHNFNDIENNNLLNVILKRIIPCLI